MEPRHPQDNRSLQLKMEPLDPQTGTTKRQLQMPSKLRSPCDLCIVCIVVCTVCVVLCITAAERNTACRRLYDTEPTCLRSAASTTAMCASKSPRTTANSREVIQGQQWSTGGRETSKTLKYTALTRSVLVRTKGEELTRHRPDQTGRRRVCGSARGAAIGHKYEEGLHGRQS
eukprot:124175-Rhodomonas_salina.5